MRVEPCTRTYTLYKYAARSNVEQFKNNANPVPPRFMGCTLEHTITIHKVQPEDQAEMHKLASNPECGKRKKNSKFKSTKMTMKDIKRMNKHNKT